MHTNISLNELKERQQCTCPLSPTVSPLKFLEYLFRTGMSFTLVCSCKMTQPSEVWSKVSKRWQKNTQVDSSEAAATQSQTQCSAFILFVNCIYCFCFLIVTAPYSKNKRFGTIYVMFHTLAAISSLFEVHTQKCKSLLVCSQIALAFVPSVIHCVKTIFHKTFYKRCTSCILFFCLAEIIIVR